jgi:hypothetical protein
LAYAIRSPKKVITSLGINTCLEEFGENRLVQMPSSIAPHFKTCFSNSSTGKKTIE